MSNSVPSVCLKVPFFATSASFSASHFSTYTRCGFAPGDSPQYAITLTSLRTVLTLHVTLYALGMGVSPS